MHVSTTAEIIALGITVLVHFLGAGVLVWGMLDPDTKDERGSWRDWWPRDDDGGPEPPAPTGPSGGGVSFPVLPDAEPSPVRLRDAGRISDARPRPSRRPDHAPEPARTPVRERETT